MVNFVATAYSVPVHAQKANIKRDQKAGIYQFGVEPTFTESIQQYFPNKTNFTIITSEQVQFVMNRLNNHPRKCLGYNTPNQIFLRVKPTVSLTS